MEYCAVCGVKITSPPEIRFGEALCSLVHAEEFVEKVLAARIQAAAALAAEASERDVVQPEPAVGNVPKQRHWTHHLKIGACVGAPLLALAFLAGGGGVLLGAAGALLPIMALLACPVAMYFMMRPMSKMGHQESPQDRAEENKTARVRESDKVRRGNDGDAGR